MDNCDSDTICIWWCIFYDVFVGGQFAHYTYEMKAEYAMHGMESFVLVNGRYGPF